ncbi:MAG: tetratricopeptide repeat protein [Chloroflexi bacterium]|nr:MAG: tetratricopeptide repeat protein [Chloroflexota bacterium]
MSSQAQAARSLISVGRPGDALRVLLQALASSPEDADLHCLLANAYIALNRPKEALDAATQAVLLAPQEEWAHRLRSIALRQLGRKKESVGAAREAVRLAPEDGYARKTLSEAYLVTGKVDDAYLQALETVRLMPASADSFDVLGRALLHKRKFKEAEANFRRALELDATDAVAHNNLGVALQRQGRRVEAVNAFNAAARIDPSFDTARKNLYSGTRVLLGGGSLVFIVLLGIRLSVVINVSQRSPILGVFAGGLVVLAIALYIRRYKPFTRKQLPPTAVAYYKAETQRLRRADRPLLLLRLASFLILAAMVALAVVLDAPYLVLIAVAITAAWYWLSPRVWRRFVQRG